MEKGAQMRGRDIFAGPYPLDAQRRMAEEAGFAVVAAPDARSDAGAPTVFPAEAQQTGAAIFFRDANLPIYPESRVLTDEVSVTPHLRMARGETQPLSIGVHAVESLRNLTLRAGAPVREDGVGLPPPRMRVLEAAYMHHVSERWNSESRCEARQLRYGACDITRPY
jgi:hypothetical protein